MSVGVYRACLGNQQSRPSGVKRSDRLHAVSLGSGLRNYGIDHTSYSLGGDEA